MASTRKMQLNEWLINGQGKSVYEIIGRIIHSLASAFIHYFKWDRNARVRTTDIPFSGSVSAGSIGWNRNQTKNCILQIIDLMMLLLLFPRIPPTVQCAFIFVSNYQPCNRCQRQIAVNNNKIIRNSLKPIDSRKISIRVNVQIKIIFIE